MNDFLYHPAGALPWCRDAASAARFWSVSLQHTQLTWFEVPPNARFERHAHPSEQITTVLEGSLSFVFDDHRQLVSAGDVIAVPGNVAHAVFAGPDGAKAFDAWSPPNASYDHE